jgi:hypothetical protein
LRELGLGIEPRSFAMSTVPTRPLSGRPSPVPERAPWILEGLALLLMFLAMVLSGAAAARGVVTAPELMGSIFAPPIFALVVIGSARLLGAARTRRSRAKVVLVTSLIMVIGQCGSLGQPRSGNSGIGAPLSRVAQRQSTSPNKAHCRRRGMVRMGPRC